MSIKDWGAYGWVEPEAGYPSWVFGQEYPWDAVLFRQYDENVKSPAGDDRYKLALPSEMLSRLYDADEKKNIVCLYPPSQLSLFGINVVMKAVWLVTIPNSVSGQITVDHHIYYNSASHGYFSATSPTISDVLVYIVKSPVELQSSSGGISTTLDLPLMALDPVGLAGLNAIVGFVPSKFTVAPQQSTTTAPPTQFKIISTTNDLMLFDSTTYSTSCGAGAGFAATPTEMKANFASNCTALQISAYFKITNFTKDYTLRIKHWKLGATDIRLTLSINGNDNTVVKYVDALEAEGGEENLLSVALRDLRYASVNFHDYLQLGLNAIQIAIEPVGGQFTADDGYGIRAISIEQD